MRKIRPILKPLSWRVAMVVGWIGVVWAILHFSADSKPNRTDAQAPTVSPPPTTLDGALSDRVYFEYIKTSPGEDPKGVYVITLHGVWLIHGTEAAKVHEATTRPAFPP